MVRVHVENFQSLKNVDLVIDKLTVVTGTNNAGKSALVRAIQSACANARGNDFVRTGATHASVRLAFDSGEFLWEKGPGGINRYTIGSQVLDRVSHGAPKDIQVFGVRAISAGGEDVWPQVARQIDGVVFLFDKPGSVMAEAVADVDRVGLLTKALRLSESDSRGFASERKIRNQDLAAHKAKRKALDQLDLLKSRWDAIQLQQKELDRLAAQVAELETFLARYQRARGLVQGLAPVVALAVRIPTTERLEKLQKAQKRVAGLEVVRDQVALLQAQASRFQRSALEDLASKTQALWDKIENAQRQDESRALSDLLETLNASKHRVDKETVAHAKASQDVGAALDSLREMVERGELCPVCHQPLGEGVVHELS